MHVTAASVSEQMTGKFLLILLPGSQEAESSLRIIIPHRWRVNHQRLSCHCPCSCSSLCGKGCDGEFWAEQPFPCGQGFGVGGSGRHSWPAGAGGCLWGTRPGPGQSVSAKWNPKCPIFKAIRRAELFLCLHLRTPHLPPQPGKMCAARATTVASRSGRRGAGSCSLLSPQGIGCLAHHQPYAGVGFCLGGGIFSIQIMLPGHSPGWNVCPGCHSLPLYSSHIYLGL